MSAPQAGCARSFKTSLGTSSKSCALHHAADVACSKYTIDTYLEGSLQGQQWDVIPAADQPLEQLEAVHLPHQSSLLGCRWMVPAGAQAQA